MRRCTRFLPSTAKWTALLLFTFAACNAASPKAFAQSPNKVIHLLCKGNYFTSGQGRIDIDLDNREIAGRREGTTHDGNGSTKVTKIAVTDAAYSWSYDETRANNFYSYSETDSIDRITGHLSQHWSIVSSSDTPRVRVGDSSAECQVITGTPAF